MPTNSTIWGYRLKRMSHLRLIAILLLFSIGASGCVFATADQRVSRCVANASWRDTGYDDTGLPLKDNPTTQEFLDYMNTPINSDRDKCKQMEKADDLSNNGHAKPGV